eukprot:1161681-Pelagomonas_calceolata.AAC.4
MTSRKFESKVKVPVTRYHILNSKFQSQIIRGWWFPRIPISKGHQGARLQTRLLLAWGAGIVGAWSAMTLESARLVEILKCACGCYYN